MSGALPPLLAPGSALSADEQARYARHLGLQGFGEEAQRRLKNARVLVIGAGGLGCAALPYLAAAGVGLLGIVDDDVVEISNLQRQVLHGVDTLGRSKTASAQARLQALNPLVQLRVHALRLDSGNALQVLADYDMVLDGSDNFSTRYLVSDAAALQHKPCIWGSILQFEGQLSVFWEGRGPTYRDLFPEPPQPGEIPSCAEAGVLGVVPGLIGTAMALEAIKLITGIGESLLGRLLLFDALAMRWREMRIPLDPERRPVVRLESDYRAFCGLPPGYDAVALSPAELRQELARAARQGQAAPVLLDVRQASEYAQAHIEAAQLLPLDQLQQRLTEDTALPFSKDTPLIVYCQSGARARQAVALLHAGGYHDLRLLDGGIHAWLQHRPD